MIDEIPLPSTDDPLDAPFWEAARRGELAVQRCSGCGTLRFPPRPMCSACNSLEHGWRTMSGKGRIWSFAVPHPPLLPAFEKLAPYNVVIVELEDDPSIRLVGNLVAGVGGAINQVDPTTIRIGQPVRAVFERVAEDVALPRWIAS